MTSSIGILETGVPPATLAARFGRYDAMMRRMIGEGHSFRTYDVQAGALPTRPEEHDAYVITGSSAGVYDALPWIAPLQQFVREAHGRTKLVGICFGHQVMAQALGGTVEKSHKGWGMGLHTYDMIAEAPWIDRKVASIAVTAVHQDQVITPPAGVTVLAASTFTPFAALAYAGGTSISVQFHPEFEHGFTAELIELRRSVLPEGFADQARASLNLPGDSPQVAGWLRRFINQA